MKHLTITMKGKTAEILLFDTIGADPFWGGGISAKDFRDQVKAIKGADILNLRINSPGGDVFECAAMMSVLDEFPGRVEVDVDGLAASAASVVAMCGKTIRMASNAMMMIHDPATIMRGSASDMRGCAEVLDKVKGQILDAYQRHSKYPRDSISAMMSEETWLTGQEAVDCGLAHEVTEPVKVSNLAVPGQLAVRLGYQHVPPVLTEAVKQMTEEDREDFRRRREIADQLAGKT